MKKLIILILWLCFSPFAFAQIKDKEIIDFDKASNPDGKAPTTERLGANKSVIWLDVVSGLLGVVSIGYERALSDNISLNLQGGITFSPPLGNILPENTFMFQFMPNFSAASDAYWTAKGYETTSYSPYAGLNSYGSYISGYESQRGEHASMCLRYFPEDDVFEGNFWGIRAQYTKFNNVFKNIYTGINNSSSTHILDDPLLTSRTYIDLIPSFGKQNHINDRLNERKINIIVSH